MNMQILIHLKQRKNFGIKKKKRGMKAIIVTDYGGNPNWKEFLKLKININ